MGLCGSSSRSGYEAGHRSSYDRKVETHTTVHQDVVCDVAVTDDAEETISCGADRTLVRYNWRQKAVVNKWKLPHTAMRLSYASRLLGAFVACRDQNIYSFQWSQPEAPVAVYSGHTLPVADVVTNEESTLLCSGSRDYSVRFWDVETRQELRATAENLNVVTCLQWIPQGDSCVVQGSEDLTLRVWDSRTFSVAQSWSSDKCFPLGVDVSEDGATIATAHNGFDGDGCYVKLWDRRKGGCLATLTGHSHAAYDCAFLPPTAEGRFLLASASKDRSIRIWDTVSGDCVATEPLPDDGEGIASEIRCLAAPQDAGGERRGPISLFSGCGAGVLHSWTVSDNGSLGLRARTGILSTQDES